jgi:cytochrome oxidase Cu insertion factor (SCO1/SenC/PrrC family)
VALSGEKMRPGIPMTRGSHTLRISLVLACILFSAPIAANESTEPSPTELIEGLLSGRAPVGGPFELTDQTGHRRTDMDFRGKLVVLYFGYTYCPDVCPTELQSISLAVDKLGVAAESVQPLFITVDPERDTPARLADFVSSFHPRLIGLTGSLADIRKTAIAYRTFFVKNNASTPATIRSTIPDLSIWSARTGDISASCHLAPRLMQSPTPSAHGLERNSALILCQFGGDDA